MKKNVLWMLIVFSLVPLLAQEYVEHDFRIFEKKLNFYVSLRLTPMTARATV